MPKTKIVAAGDVLLHSRVYNRCKTKDGEYDFTKVLGHAKKLLKSGDLTVVNLESIVAGTEFGLSSYPKFNNPIEVAQTLKNFGTDIVTLANNHAFDHGEEGLLKSIKNLKEIDLPYTGAFTSKKDRRTHRIFKRNGLRIGVLSFSRHFKRFNNIAEDKDYLVNIFDEQDPIPLRLKIQKFKNSGLVDVVVVALHFGREYTLYPTSTQREVAAEIADFGADVIIGHHPHVLQPPEYIITSKGRKCFFIPSLGNFYTGQHGVYRQIGATLSINVEKEDDQLRFQEPTLDLTFVDAANDFKMHSFFDYIKKNPFIHTKDGDFESLEVATEIVNRMRTFIPDLIVK